MERPKGGGANMVRDFFCESFAGEYGRQARAPYRGKVLRSFMRQVEISLGRMKSPEANS